MNADPVLRLRVSRHDPVALPFVAATLLPAARTALRSGAVSARLGRHWLRGPHLWLECRSAPGTDHRGLAEEQARLLRAGLTERPSAAPVDEPTWAERAVRLGREEPVVPPYGPLTPDNRVDVEIADRRADPVEGYAARWHTRALSALAASVQAIERGAGIDDVLLSVLVGVAHGYRDGGALRGQLSLRSHAEDYLGRHDPQGTVRQRWEGAFTARRDALTARVNRLLAVLATDPAVPGGHDGPRTGERESDLCILAQQWFRAARAGQLDAIAMLVDGQFPLPEPQRLRRVAGQVAPDRGPRLEMAAGAGYTDFHRALLAVDVAALGVDRYRDFTAYRAAVNLTYEVLPLLDVAPARRLLMSWFVSRAVEESYGTSWSKLIASPEGAR